MNQVAMTINGRVYRLTCDESERERLMQLGATVASRVDEFTAAFGQVGENRLLFLAALRLADELLDATTQLQSGAPVETLNPKKNGAAQPPKLVEAPKAPSDGAADTKNTQNADEMADLDPVSA